MEDNELDPEQSLSFTHDDDGNVLELVLEDGDGNLFYRDGGEWVPVGPGEDHPTIFDRSMLDVDPEQSDAATDFWDGAADDDVDVESVHPFERMHQ